MPTQFFYLALVRISLVGFVLCLAAYLCELFWPKLGSLMARPAQIVASVIGVLLLVLCMGLIIGFPRPLLDLLGKYRFW